MFGKILEWRSASSTNAFAKLLQHHFGVAQQVSQAKVANAVTQLGIELNSGNNAAIRNFTPTRADLRGGLREACACV
jgi:hypothetical protein